MVRRVIDSDRTSDAYAESEVVVRPSVASVIAGVLSAVYVFVVAVIGLWALLRGLGARQSNGFVHAVSSAAHALVAPFTGMFSDQRWWASALIAVVVYTVAYLILMAVLRRDRAL
jgi:hypothetical protein